MEKSNNYNTLHLGKYLYSISDRNHKGEFVVVKINNETRQILEARIIKASTKPVVHFKIKTGNFEKYPLLPGSLQKQMLN